MPLQEYSHGTLMEIHAGDAAATYVANRGKMLKQANHKS